MALTLNQLQQEVKKAGFNDGDLASITIWLNARLVKLWSLEDWSFRYATAAPTVSTGVSTVAGLPTDLRIANGLYNSDGSEILYRPPRQFYETFQGDTTSGQPRAYTIVNGTLTVGPTPAADDTLLLLYERLATELVNPADTPSLPPELHRLLIPGAIAEGLTTKRDYIGASTHDQVWADGIAAVREFYLTDQRGDEQQYGRDPLAASV